MTNQGLKLDFDVSRETLNRLHAYQRELLRWTKKINLISPTTIDAAWTRHFVDSAQLFNITTTDTGHWVDLGSGGGFPGLVCAVIAAEKKPEITFTLVESDARKCAFLRSAIRVMDLKATVICSRIESTDELNATVLSARALSSLKNLLEMAARHGGRDCQFLFSKGKNWMAEVEEAQKEWSFSLISHKSKTNNEAVILEIRDITYA